MIPDLIRSDYYEEIGKTNFAKDLREEDISDMDGAYYEGCGHHSSVGCYCYLYKPVGWNASVGGGRETVGTMCPELLGDCNFFM